MVARRVHLHLLFGLICLIAVSSCEQLGCSSTDFIAELDSRSGNVERDFAAKINKWEDAPVKSTFVMNDGVRTRTNSSARLTLQEGSIVVMKPKTQLRFSASEPTQNKFGVVIEEGEANIEAASDDLEIETGIGLATLKKGSRINLSTQNNELAIEVDIGSAQFVSSTGETFDLNEGDDILLSIGTAQLVLNTAEDTEATDDTVSSDVEIEITDDAEAPDLDAEDSPESEHKGPRYQGAEEVPEDMNTADTADFAIVAGQRAFVHTSQFPVAIEFKLDGICPGDAHVKVQRKKIRGTGTTSVILNLPSGGHRYEVRCVEDNMLGEVAKKGRLTILRDLGKSTLSLSAPVSYVDTDGRDYRLMYQSKLPIVVVKWPDAPSASGYTLHVTGASGTKSYTIRTPQYRFSSGALDEGSYKFKFTASGSGKRSRTSSMKIAFDNATPKAVLKSPQNGGFSKGATVTVSGIALPGWNASVFGQDLSMDSEHRFSGTAKHLDNYLSLPVKLTHATRGTHYFLRRAK
ncbi:MAG: FecR domain-containing protein [Deltaproteobacteria bacterium]|nr:FecR domain-containing protein [Deltaproteobacteria bacterium]MBN2673559.1 FecR domain-containing protein [Deltaproteobacteria bacterium]